MRCLVLVLFVATTLARPGPDVSHLKTGHGYKYKIPSTSYGVPILPEETQAVPTNAYLPVPTGTYLPANPNFREQTDTYYFADEEEIEQPRLHINVVPSNLKSTNVVFVKAPSYAPAVPEVHAPPAQVEDKTKVVVLVKKPEEQAPFNVVAAPPNKYGKPEVVIVKYNNENEAKQAVSGSGEHLLESNIKQVENKHTFVKTLEGNAHTKNDNTFVEKDEQAFHQGSAFLKNDDHAFIQGSMDDKQASVQGSSDGRTFLQKDEQAFIQGSTLKKNEQAFIQVSMYDPAYLKKDEQASIQGSRDDTTFSKTDEQAVIQGSSLKKNEQAFIQESMDDTTFLKKSEQASIQGSRDDTAFLKKDEQAFIQGSNLKKNEQAFIQESMGDTSFLKKDEQASIQGFRDDSAFSKTDEQAFIQGSSLKKNEQALIQESIDDTTFLKKDEQASIQGSRDDATFLKKDEQISVQGSNLQQTENNCTSVTDSNYVQPAPSAQVKEKTKVVLLAKEPEEQPPFNFQAPPPVKQGEPEVVLLKYKDHHEAKQAVAGLFRGQTLGSNIPQVKDHTFFKALEGIQAMVDTSIGQFLESNVPVERKQSISKNPYFHSSPAADVYVPPAQIEDNTKVVVLFKKPEDQAYEFHAPAPVKLGQPEVVVFKYKDHQEVKQAVAGLSRGHNLGSNVPQISDQITFVETLENNKGLDPRSTH